MNEKELLDKMEQLDPSDIIMDETSTLDHETLQRIKAKTFAKLDLPETATNVKPFIRKRRTSWSRFSKVAVAIIVIVLIIPVSVTALTGIYKYVPNLGNVVKTDEDLYDIIDLPTVTTNIGVATLESFIYVNQNYADTQVNIKFNDTQNIVKEDTLILDEATLIINGERFGTDIYGSGYGSEDVSFSHYFYNLPAIKQSDEVYYEFALADGTTYQFAVNLKWVDGEAALEDVGPTDTKQDLTITAKVREEKDVLDVNFISVDQFNARITDYCLAAWSNETCAITLMDAQGNTVEAVQVFHHDRNNHFQFDVSNLVKPYVITINSVIQNVNTIHNGGIKQRIKLPKMNQTLTQVPTLKVDGYSLPIKSLTLTDKSNENFPLSLESDEVAGLNIQFDVSKDYVNGKRIKDIQIQSHNLSNPFSGAFPTFKGYGATMSQDGFVEQLDIGLKRKPSTLTLYIWSYDVEVQGNWEFVVN